MKKLPSPCLVMFQSTRPRGHDRQIYNDLSDRSTRLHRLGTAIRCSVRDVARWKSAANILGNGIKPYTSSTYLAYIVSDILTAEYDDFRRRIT